MCYVTQGEAGGARSTTESPAHGVRQGELHHNKVPLGVQEDLFLCAGGLRCSLHASLNAPVFRLQILPGVRVIIVNPETRGPLGDSHLGEVSHPREP